MRSRHPFGTAAALAAAAASLFSACGDSPTGPEFPLEVVTAGGDWQYGSPGQRLEKPLEALVRRTDTGSHLQGIELEWSVERGDASISTPRTVTDADGYARVTVQLGSRTDTVRVRVTVRGDDASARFTALVVERPVLESLSATRARAGDTLTLSGRSFHPDPAQNVVLFSGIRGRVVSSSTTSLRVEVPPCLPSRTVDVTAQLGTLVSGSLSLSVDDAGRQTALSRGEYLDVDESQGVSCLRLSGDGAGYLVMALTAGTVGAARYGYVLRGLTAAPSAAPWAAPEASPPVGAPEPGDAPFPVAWEARLRAREDALVRIRSPGERASSAPARAAVPAVGERRSFKVLNAQGGFDDVNAVARVVGAQAVIYVDETAPAGGYTDAELRTFVEAFDGVVHSVVTSAYGSPSDLDGNARVVILFTPTVNRMTPRGSTGFVGGFFYGLDLLTDRVGSNKGEIFYALVPDTAGIHSDPRTKQRILDVVPPILAHEFQHMIHFNERVLKLGAAGNDALWLSEGLAQMAEELVARFYQDAGQVSTADRFREGNDDRARRYLLAPEEVSLIFTTGQGSLEERGAAWLFVLYLWDLQRDGDVLGRLTRTTRTGTQNVTWVEGRPWVEVLADWMGALYVDGLPTGPYPFEYPRLTLRGRIRTAGGAYPLAPESLTGDFTRSGSLWSSSVAHYIVIPPRGGVVVRLGGEAGGAAPAEAALRLRVARLY